MPANIKMVMFDLDGTLLPMDMDEFTGGYFKLLAKKAMPFGYEPESLIKVIWQGVASMVKNDGSCLNEEAFWKAFREAYGQEKMKDKHIFDEFYAVEFNQAKIFCGFNPLAAETVRKIKEDGYRVGLATNPLFPSIATENRIKWTGLTPDEFEFYTTYENIGYCKPNPQYYTELLHRLNLKPEDCLMVGNDVEEDVIAGELGMKVFLITDCLLNKKGKDISVYPHGGFTDLYAWLQD